MTRRVFTENAWSDYTYWQTQDKKTIRRINALIEDACRDGYTGIGKPEPLRGDLHGFWSRRINERHRLIYRINGDAIEILACRFHTCE